MERNTKQDPVEPAVELAYTTTTGDVPVSKLAKVTTKTGDPALKPRKRIAKKTTKKRTPRTSAPAVTHTDIKVDQAVMKAARNIVSQGIYTKVQIVDAETVIVR